MAKAATRRGVPLLGVNIGTMGFMAELESTELEKLSMLATGEFTTEKRMMLDVTVQRSRDILFHDICLNDAVITKGVIARIVHLSVKCDGIQAMECGGDGVIVATLPAPPPTVFPPEAHCGAGANNIIITPICAHEWAAGASWHPTGGSSPWRWCATPGATLCLRGRRQGVPAESGRCGNGSEISSGNETGSAEGTQFL